MCEFMGSGLMVFSEFGASLGLRVEGAGVARV